MNLILGGSIVNKNKQEEDVADFLRRGLPCALPSPGYSPGPPTPPADTIYAAAYQIGILGGGQSNYAGENSPDTPSAPYNAAISGTRMRSSGGSWGTIIFPSNNLGAIGGANFGPELSLNYTLQAFFNRMVFNVKVSKTGASMFSSPTDPHFNIDSAGADPLYPTLLANGLALRDRIVAMGKTPKIILVWYQGERDCLNSTTVAAWRTNFMNMVNQLIADGVPIYKIIIDINDPTQTAGTPTNLAALIASKNSLVADNAGYIYGQSMVGIPRAADNIHYTGPGQITNGLNAASIITTNIFTANEVITGTYSAEAKAAFLNFASLPTAWKDIMATFIDSQVASGNWAKQRFLQIRWMNNEANSLIDLKGIANAINVGGVHTPKIGMAYNGTSTYLNTGFDPSIDGGSLYTLNDAAFGWGVIINSVTTTGQLGGVTSSGAVRNYIGQESGTQLAYRVNCNLNSTYLTDDFFANNSNYIARRNAASGAGATALNKNGVDVATTTTVSTSMPVGPMFEGCNDNLGVPGGFLQVQVGWAGASKSVTFDFANFNTNLNIFKAAAALL